MKIILSVAILIFFKNISFSQVYNDDCSSALNMGILSHDHNSVYCVDGTINTDTTIIGSNINATPSNPYHCMIGCLGYSLYNHIVSDDVWYRFKAESFSIRFFPYYITGQPLQPLHLNAWYGSDCNSLNSVGCYTFFADSGYYETSFLGADTTNWVYLQISGNGTGVQGDFAFCITTDPNSVPSHYGTSVSCTSSSSSEINQPNYQIYPIPAKNYFYIAGDVSLIKQVTIYNSFGRLVYFEAPKNDLINISNLTSGAYYVKLDLKDNSRTFLLLKY